MYFSQNQCFLDKQCGSCSSSFFSQDGTCRLSTKSYSFYQPHRNKYFESNPIRDLNSVIKCTLTIATPTQFWHKLVCCIIVKACPKSIWITYSYYQWLLQISSVSRLKWHCLKDWLAASYFGDLDLNVFVRPSFNDWMAVIAIAWLTTCSKATLFSGAAVKPLSNRKVDAKTVKASGINGEVVPWNSIDHNDLGLINKLYPKTSVVSSNEYCLENHNYK